MGHSQSSAWLGGGIRDRDKADIYAVTDNGRQEVVWKHRIETPNPGWAYQGKLPGGGDI